MHLANERIIFKLAKLTDVTVEVNASEALSYFKIKCFDS